MKQKKNESSLASRQSINRRIPKSTDLSMRWGKQSIEREEAREQHRSKKTSLEGGGCSALTVGFLLIGQTSGYGPRTIKLSNKKGSDKEKLGWKYESHHSVKVKTERKSSQIENQAIQVLGRQRRG